MSLADAEKCRDRGRSRMMADLASCLLMDVAWEMVQRAFKRGYQESGLGVSLLIGKLLSYSLRVFCCMKRFVAQEPSGDFFLLRVRRSLEIS